MEEDLLILEPCPYCKREPSIHMFQNGFVEVACEYYGCNIGYAVGGLTLEKAVEGWNRKATEVTT